MLDQKMLDKMNQILNSKYTFKFCDISDDTPEGELLLSMIQARIISEGICRYIVLYKKIVKNENSIRTTTLEVFLTKLNLSMIIPKEVRESLKFIQGCGNHAAHYQVDGAMEVDAVQLCMKALKLVIGWFIDEYDGTSLSDVEENAEFSTDRMGMIPEMVEGCVISREDEVLAVWKILHQSHVILIHGESGTGKTEFCKEYVNRNKKKYNSVYYAENVSSVDHFILDLPFKIEDKSTKKHEQILREKWNLFKKLNNRHLFILDNYVGQDYSWLIQLISDVHCHIIITRTERLPIDSIQSMVLKDPSISDGIKLFEYFDPIPLEQMELQELIEHLGKNLRLIKLCAVFMYSRQNKADLMQLIKGIETKRDDINNILKKTCAIILDNKSMDEKSRKTLGLLSLLPYSGVPFDVIAKWSQIACNGENMRDTLESLFHSHWFSIDDNGCMVISQTISDVLFEELDVNPYAEASVRMLKQVFDIIKNYLNLTDNEIHVVEPYVNLYTNRVLATDIAIINDGEERSRRRSVLTMLRDYHIAIYELSYATPLVEKIHKVINLEKNDRFIDEEYTIYKEGETLLKLERFDEACSKFDMSLKKLDEKIARIKKNYALISAQYAHALAYAGQYENALAMGEYSIRLRKEVNPKAVWISYYNYALALYKAGRLGEAMDCCEKTIRRFLDIYNEEDSGFYYNLSSPLHLRGQIYMAMGNTEAAIYNLEKSAKIRKERNGENTYWMAQIYGYLSEAYEMAGNKGEAVQYALRSKKIREKFHKDDNITEQIEELEKRIRRNSIDMTEVKAEIISVRNNKRTDKPNEDMVYANDNTGVYIVLDGVSRDPENDLYPNPSPAVIATERFLQYCVKRLEKELVPNDQDPAEFLKEIVKKANQDLNEYNKILGHRFPAGTVGIVSFVWGQFLYYAYIGDCTGVFIHKGIYHPFTIKQTNEVMRHKKEFTSDEIRFQICNHIEHPCGYGVWDGNDAAMNFVMSGSIPIHDGDIIIMHSDGADELIDKTPIKIMIEDSLESIIEQYCSHTSNQDDLSIVRIRFGGRCCK